MSERFGGDPDAMLRGAIEDVQRRVAQETGDVPHMPFVEGPDGTMHELVEEDIRYPEERDGE